MTLLAADLVLREVSRGARGGLGLLTVTRLVAENGGILAAQPLSLSKRAPLGAKVPYQVCWKQPTGKNKTLTRRCVMLVPGSWILPGSALAGPRCKSGEVTVRPYATSVITASSGLCSCLCRRRRVQSTAGPAGRRRCAGRPPPLLEADRRARAGACKRTLRNCVVRHMHQMKHLRVQVAWRAM